MFLLILHCCSAALVTQAKEPAVIEVQPGGNATLPCGISVNMELSWFSLQSDHIPVKVMNLEYRSRGKINSSYIRDEYRGRMTPIFNSTHSLQLKNITEADLLIYCCIQITGLKFGNCTMLKFTDHAGGQSTHPIQPSNHDLLPWILLPCVALLTGSISSLCCYFCHNQAPLRKSSDSQQRGSRTSRHDQVLSLTGLSVAFRPQRESVSA
ncbi:uncharacterized protein LOC125739990 isoform X1 [Brienomyrus brachyistius]|uniref:uncharacterized protein LOC125739988 isoform X2 n=1 Tax=Brienomyrus brachyistius TaxID=42636 RepID=UPI0020B27B1D|nr:uncharacterized protein LOC125739988 isoform X2 [Brienomyrus brachyistius]XP_048866567.1 uncharacterized protein LOC125739990 isoform X1 [Brienomyrus brachyistius]